LIFYPVFLSGFRLVPAYSIDPRLNLYLLEHSFQWLAGNPLHSDFWSPPMFYPAQHTLGFTDAMAGYGWLYWPFRFMGISPESSYDLWLVFSCVINFMMMYAGLRRLLRIDIAAASTGAYVFAFGIPRMAQLVHAQLLPGMYVLLMIAGFFMAVDHSPWPATRTGRLWVGWLCMMLGAVLQFYSGFYNLWFAVFGLSVLVMISFFIRDCRKDVLRSVQSPAPVIVSIAAVAMIWPLLSVYLGVLDDTGARSMDEIRSMLPGWRSWLYVGSSNVAYGWIYDKWPGFIPPDMTHEHVIGLGIVSTIMAVIGLFGCRKQPWVRAVLVVVALLLVLTWNYSEKWNPWFYVAEWVPGASAIRAVSRVSIFLLIPLSAGIAFQLHRMSSRGWRNVLIAVIVLEQWMVIPANDPAPTAQRVAAITQLARAHGKPFYVTKKVGPDYKRGNEIEFHMDAMWAGMEANLPVVNGYSGTVPPKWLVLYFNTVEVERDRKRLDNWLAAWMREYPENINQPVMIEVQD
jgi:hypothetical protein